MGQKPRRQAPAPPPPPPPTVKEICKKSTRAIKKMQREFNREKRKLETANKKITNDIKKMLKKGDSRTNVRIVAQGIAKNQKLIKRYTRLSAQMDNALASLQQAQTANILCGVMNDMNKIFKITGDQMNVKNIQQVSMEFQMQMEKQDLLQQQMEEAMEFDDEEEISEDAEKIIQDIEFAAMGGANGGGGGGGQMNMDPAFSNMNPGGMNANPGMMQPQQQQPMMGNGGQVLNGDMNKQQEMNFDMDLAGTGGPGGNPGGNPGPGNGGGDMPF